jgi:xanthine dehydrogenase accessory factor
MRKLSELIVLVRGGGEVGSAIAHRLYRSHFRVAITEVASPLALNRYTCFSEAVYNTKNTVEDVTAERSLPNLENIYKVWRNHNIPIVVDPELAIKPLIKPDVLINAMMLNRETSTKIEDSPLVIGIGTGFTVGIHAHMVVESNFSNNLGRVIIEGESEPCLEKPGDSVNLSNQNVILAEDAGVFKSEKNIGDAVLVDDILGYLNDVAIKAPVSGILRGLIRNEVKVLANTKIIEIDTVNDKSVCFSIRDKMRAVAGGVLEAIMMAYNLDDMP